MNYAYQTRKDITDAWSCLYFTFSTQMTESNYNQRHVTIKENVSVL